METIASVRHALRWAFQTTSYNDGSDMLHIAEATTCVAMRVVL